MLLARVLETFGRTYVSSRKLLIGTQGLPLEIALAQPASALLS